MIRGIFYSVIGLVALGACQQADAAIFSVSAFANSTSGGIGLNTGINLNAGDFFTATASTDDLWSLGILPRFSDADGLVGDRFASATDDSGEVVGTLIGANFGLHSQFGENFPFGTVVGEIGGIYFVLGTNFAGVAPATGILSLYLWDSNNVDNTGEIEVTINAGSPVVPEPSSMILASCALAGLGLRTRRRKS